MIALPPIVLGSGSPRRAEILSSVGWEFTKSVPEIDETVRDGELPDAYVQRLADEKAKAVAQMHPDQLVLAADTTVVVDDQILGKPDDLEHARGSRRPATIAR